MEVLFNVIMFFMAINALVAFLDGFFAEGLALSIAFVVMLVLLKVPMTGDLPRRD